MSKKLTNVEIDSKLKNRNIKRIDDYKGNNKTKIQFQCIRCNNVWKSNTNNILSKNSGCPKCNLIHYNNDYIDVQLKNRNIKRLDNYINANTPIRFQCEIDDSIWKTSPSNIVGSHNTGCPCCANRVRKPTLTNKDIDKRLLGKTIKRIGNYVNAKTKLKFQCLDCGYMWESLPHNCLDKKANCRKCHFLSDGENNIHNLITKHFTYNYFEPHKPFYFNERQYVPDFYLENKNKKIIVEYHGQQHYKPVRFNGKSKYMANKCFKKQQLRDKELREYCKNNDIYLLEIPYYWKDEEVIKQLTLLNDLA